MTVRDRRATANATPPAHATASTTASALPAAAGSRDPPTALRRTAAGTAAARKLRLPTAAIAARAGTATSSPRTKTCATHVPSANVSTQVAEKRPQPVSSPMTSARPRPIGGQPRSARANRLRSRGGERQDRQRIVLPARGRRRWRGRGRRMPSSEPWRPDPRGADVGGRRPGRRARVHTVVTRRGAPGSRARRATGVGGRRCRLCPRRSSSRAGGRLADRRPRIGRDGLPLYVDHAVRMRTGSAASRACLVLRTVLARVGVLPRIDRPVRAARLPVPRRPGPLGIERLVLREVVAGGTGCRAVGRPIGTAAGPVPRRSCSATGSGGTRPAAGSARAGLARTRRTGLGRRRPRPIASMAL